MTQKPQQNLNEVIYFLIDTTTRSMRRYSHQKLKESGARLTLDQFVVMKLLEENTGISQVEIAEKLFKDNASITRIIELLVKKELVDRKINSADRRTFSLELTEEGRAELERCKPIVFEIREMGVEGITNEDIDITKKVLNKIKKKFY